MNIDVENTISNILDEINHIEVNDKYFKVYEDVKNEELKILFSALHHILTEEFKLMNHKLPANDSDEYFWAENSRNLISCIDNIEQLYNSLNNTSLSFKIDNYYKNILEDCKVFLRKYKGSTIPKGMKKINIYSKKKIFVLESLIEVEYQNVDRHTPIKSIGEGSYAKVFKYKDLMYNKHFAIKKAKKNLSAKELERFKVEYESLKKLDSPYIIEVYKYDNQKNLFYMECMDMNLLDYIQKENTNLSIVNRKKIVKQIIKGFSYIHSKGMLHRDISPKNILIKKYNDGTVIVKISDFGLVKVDDSILTSVNTKFKGAFNDPGLMHNFIEYSKNHEIYSLTFLIYFVMTGKITMKETQNSEFNKFISIGTNSDETKRFKNIYLLEKEFLRIKFQ
ncbi:protein kinase family protein [Mammaliicoccus sciuri]|uniref:protein kinase family protein n=1 Tax=Mammaliicoccus sciuri TaxID=1296 RepID=UPI0037C6FC68